MKGVPPPLQAGCSKFFNCLAANLPPERKARMGTRAWLQPQTLISREKSSRGGDGSQQPLQPLRRGPE